mgnify:FL=1
MCTPKTIKKMKKFLLMWLALFAVSVVSCGDSKQDEPKSPEDTDYGEIKPTGVKRAVIYYNEADGETSFTIPGFPKFEFVSLLGGGYEIWNVGVCGFNNLYDNSVSVADVHWDGSGVFKDSWDFARHNAAICRLKISKSGEYPERFVYARMCLVDLLHSGSGTNIGVVIEYDAPYTIGE